MHELGMDNQNPILGSSAIPGLADQTYSLVDIRSPLTPLLAPGPFDQPAFLAPYDPRPLSEDGFAVINRTIIPMAVSGQCLDLGAIYVVTSTGESLDQLESELLKAGTNTIQLDENSSLFDLITQLKAQGYTFSWSWL